MIDWNSSGRLFHSLGPLKVKARWPAAVLQSGICRRSLFLVLRLCTFDLVLNFWQRYGGTSPFKRLNTMVASLTSICLTIGSHCKCLRASVSKTQAKSEISGKNVKSKFAQTPAIGSLYWTNHRYLVHFSNGFLFWRKMAILDFRARRVKITLEN